MSERDKNTGDTVEFVVPAPKDRQAPQPYSSLVQVDAFGLSHQGLVRPNNEDHFLTLRFGRYLIPLQTNLPEDDRPSLSEEAGFGMVVADGIGGSVAGELASKLAINTFVNLLLRTADWILRLDDDYYEQQVIRRAWGRVQEVNSALTEKAQADPNLRGFGTTLTLAFSLGKDLIIAHVGDSRAYIFRDGVLAQLTQDHTVAQTMANEGAIRQRDVAKSRFRHVLTRSLGMDVENLVPDIEFLTLRDKDCLLLCTDGLTDMVPSARIAMILGAEEPAEKTCARLLDEALTAGGRDNITVALGRYRLPQRG
jgi:serine/threonine protein phosphatase PrpC